MIWGYVSRIFPPVMQAIALGVAVVGCFVESRISSMYTPYSGSIEEQRVERQVGEELSGDPTAVPQLKNYQRQYVLDFINPSVARAPPDTIITSRQSYNPAVRQL